MLHENRNCTILCALSYNIIGNLKKNLNGQRIEIYSFQDTLSELPFFSVLLAKQ